MTELFNFCFCKFVLTAVLFASTAMIVYIANDVSREVRRSKGLLNVSSQSHTVSFSY